MGLSDRIDKLERQQPPEQCSKCHDRQTVVYVRGEPAPEPCPKCGKLPKWIVEAVDAECAQLVLRVLAGERTEGRRTNEDTESK